MDIKHEIIEPNFTVKICEELRGKRFHWHRRIEILYIEQGYCDVTITDKVHRAEQGDIIFIRSGEIHELKSELNKVKIKIITFNPSLLQRLNVDFVCIENHITTAMQSKVGINKKIKYILDEIYEEYDQEKYFNDIVIILDLIKLYSLLARHFPNKKMMENKNFAKFKVFQEVLEYISKNFTEEISLKTVAEKTNYCEAYVSTLFVNFTGVNFKTYIDTIRIKYAADLLEKTDYTIGRIASECGYENLKTFNNTFKRITNSTPSEYRGKNF